MNLYESRYRAGDRRQVWTEISGLSYSALTVEARGDVDAVAEATMARVSRNVDVIVEGLRSADYRFANPKHVRRPPTQEDVAAVQETEDRLGTTLSPALKACLLTVGEVDLTGSHPGWQPAAYAFDGDVSSGYPVYADPLVLPNATYLLEEIIRWDEECSGDERRTFRWLFAPDELHKANISGRTHDIHLPDSAIDPILRGVRRRDGIRLTEYLRTSLSWGGFPGFEFAETVPAPLAELRAGLLPI